MRALLVMLALVGCNEYYGLDSVGIRDARQFDGPTSCPPIGGTLDFAPLVEQLLVDCSSYTASSDLAIALCTEPGRNGVYGGPPEGPLVWISELPEATPLFLIYDVKLSADGSLLLMRIDDGLGKQLRTYRLAGATWMRGADVASAPAQTSNASRGPDHRIIGSSMGDAAMLELSDASGDWTAVRTHPLAPLGLAFAFPLWLSGDGLRLVFFGNTTPTRVGSTINYADRASTSDPFQTMQRLAVAVTEDVFLSEDCSRAYFSGLRSVFYARRR